ncbi:hypothetical protein [Brevundimonas sp. NIBR11]|uniref:hypothetical protein n=1 Tax=Brevundimonas sp. NIBR11 TaxID=3015999 RepID=UPI0022F0F29E|nr:hypothetical protein [Brevundimonas sp. NIBR11]WGM31599.1 hypothetical protein KKHFBJBL_01846 [Brevundimonas sp. NIBR11]
MTFSATEAAFEGFRVVRRHPLAVLFWGLAYALMYGVVFGLFGGPLTSMMAAMIANMTEGASSATEIEQLGESSAGIIWLLAPLLLVLGSVTSAAVARAVLRPSESAFGYLRLGGDELRVLAVSVVLFIVTLGASMLLFGLTGVLVELAKAVNAGVAILVLILFGCASVGALLWLTVRLSLAVPITVAEQRIAPFASFALTKGQTPSLLGMAILAGVMSMLVSLLVSVVALPATIAIGGESGLMAYAGRSTLEILQQAAPVVIVWVLVNALQGALQLAVLYAPFSAAYRDLKGLPHE